MTTKQQIRTNTWAIDKTHTNVDFSVKHLMFTTVRGHFRDFEGRFYIDEDNVANSTVEASIDVASIDTNLPDRDAHLRSDDFFNAEQFPKITFRSTRVEAIDERRAKVYGDLTIRDVTRAVALDVEFEGRIGDPWGNERAAFTAQTKISRNDFNVRWNQALETGGVVVGDEVKIALNVEAIRD